MPNGAEPDYSQGLADEFVALELFLLRFQHAMHFGSVSDVHECIDVANTLYDAA